MMRAVSYGFVAAGIVLVLLIGYGQHQNDRKTDRLMDQLQALPFEESNSQEELSGAEANRIDTAIADPAEADVQEREMAIAVIEIPAIELKAPVVEGAGQKQLKSAVGRLTDSGMLGITGDNVALAGHRTGMYGGFFNRLDELEPGDDVFVTSAEGLRIAYRVTGKQVVKPTDVEVLNPVPNSTLLTLITCHPLHSNKYRLIVSAERVEADPTRTT